MGTGLNFAGDWLLSLDDDPALWPRECLAVFDVLSFDGDKDFLLRNLADCLVGVNGTCAVSGDLDREAPFLVDLDIFLVECCGDKLSDLATFSCDSDRDLEVALADLCKGEELGDFEPLLDFPRVDGETLGELDPLLDV